ncbi:MAG: hypothetical protein AB2A00_08855 [Myxococcota bacterium]
MTQKPSWLFLGALCLAAACTGPNPLTNTGNNNSGETRCERNSDCASGQFCRDGTCAEGCASNRDCPSGQTCDTTVNRCVGPEQDAGNNGGTDASITRRDAGQRDANVTIPPVGEEEVCNPALNNCTEGLRCVSLGQVGARCVSECNPVAGTECAAGRQCVDLGDGTGACLRMLGRDEQCIDIFTGMVDEMAFCEPDLIRLVDNPDAPTLCACKLACTLSECPGDNCECPASEQCVDGVLSGGTLGLCGTTAGPGEACDDPFSYPMGTSLYCETPPGIPPNLPQPYPYCFFEDFVNFESVCWLICEYPNAISSTCPPGMRCELADPDVWGDGVKACQYIPDAGPVVDAGIVVDAGRVDAGTTPDATVTTDAGITVDAGPPDAAISVDAGRPDAGIVPDAAPPPDASVSVDAALPRDAGLSPDASTPDAAP